jgi:type I site-specific restriction endonuclease
MAQNITLDDFYALFRESERQRQETECLLRESLEASRQQFERELAESRAEYDRRIAKTKLTSAQSPATMHRDFQQRKIQSIRGAAPISAVAHSAAPQADRNIAPLAHWNLPKFYIRQQPNFGDSPQHPD